MKCKVRFPLSGATKTEKNQTKTPRKKPGGDSGDDSESSLKDTGGSHNPEQAHPPKPTRLLWATEALFFLFAYYYRFISADRTSNPFNGIVPVNPMELSSVM